MRLPPLARSLLSYWVAVLVGVVGSPPAHAAKLRLSAKDLHFGNVVVGKTGSLSATVTNASKTAVKITSIRSSAKVFVVPKLTFPVTLEPGHHLALHIGFHPAGAGQVNGTVRFNATEATLRVHGWGVNPEPVKSALRATPPSLAFGSVQVGENVKRPITLTNIGTSSITLSGRGLRGAGFTIAGRKTSLTLEPAHSLTFTLTFVPHNAGTFSGELTFAERGQAALAIPLRGTGTSAGRLNYLPAGMNFGKVIVGSSASRSGTLTANDGSVTVRSVTSSSPGFVVSGVSLPATIAAGNSLHYTVTFKPRQGGDDSARVSFVSSAADASLSMRVYGSGVSTSEPPPTASLRATPASLTFGNVQVGESDQLRIALTNTGTSSVTISEGQLRGAGFSIVGLSSALTLAAGQSFTFAIEFAPQASGAVSGGLTFTAPGRTALVIALRGAGTSAGGLSDAPAAMNFGNVTVGTSVKRSGTLSAREGNVNVSSVTSSSPEFVVTGLSLPATIAAGQTLHYTVMFTPQQSGAVSASLSFTSNASDANVSEALSGSGVVTPKQFVTLSWNASTSQVVGYNVYRGGKTGGPYAKISAGTNSTTTFTDTTVTSGNTYFYVITAVNSKGQESKFSNQAQVRITQ
jgi:Abnormal spindle-like microcephaly-assoc'd, ASPM-SPD-2-Hydin